MTYMKASLIKKYVHSKGYRISKDALESIDRGFETFCQSLIQICKDDHVKTITVEHVALSRRRS